MRLEVSGIPSMARLPSCVAVTACGLPQQVGSEPRMPDAESSQLVVQKNLMHVLSPVTVMVCALVMVIYRPNVDSPRFSARSRSLGTLTLSLERCCTLENLCTLPCCRARVAHAFRKIVISQDFDIELVLILCSPCSWLGVPSPGYASLASWLTHTVPGRQSECSVRVPDPKRHSRTLIEPAVSPHQTFHHPHLRPAAAP